MDVIRIARLMKSLYTGANIHHRLMPRYVHYITVSYSGCGDYNSCAGKWNALEVVFVHFL